MSQTNLCRLCVNICQNGKSLYNGSDGLRNELYDIICTFFHPKIVDLAKAKHLTTICSQCAKYIADFKSFQTMVEVAQLVLLPEEDEEYKVLDIKVEEEFISVPDEIKIVQTDETSLASENCNLTQNKEYHVENEKEEDLNQLTDVCSQFPVIEPEHENILKISEVQVRHEGNFSIIIEIESGEQNLFKTTEVQRDTEDNSNLLDDRTEPEEDNLLQIAEEQVDIEDNSKDRSVEVENCASTFATPDVKEENDNDYSSEDDIPLSRLVNRESSAVSIPKPSTSGLRKERPYFNDLVSKWLPTIQCVECPETFSMFSLYRQHFRQNHSKSIFYLSCCGLKHRVISKIEEHMQFHSNPKSFKCKLCGKCLRNKANLAYHMNGIHPETQKKTFKCQKCNKSFTTRKGLSFHYTKQHGALKRPQRVVQDDGSTMYFCQDCKYSTPLYQRFSHHRWFEHSPRTSFNCHICDKGFKLASLLRAHLAIHVGRCPYQCTLCPAGFRWPGNFERHMKKHDWNSAMTARRLKGIQRTGSYEGSVTKKSKVYPCSFCTCKFSQQRNLNYHVKKKHAQVTAAVTPEPGDPLTSATVQNETLTPTEKDTSHCEMSLGNETPTTSKETKNKAKTKAVIKQTPREAKKSKPEKRKLRERKCKFCNARFQSVEGHMKHLLHKHEGRGLHQCSSCLMNFTCRNALTNHRKVTHPSKARVERSGIKGINGRAMDIYQCSYCPRSFINKSNFELHNKLSHLTELKNISNNSDDRNE